MVNALDMIGRLDAAIGPIKQRRRGHQPVMSAQCEGIVSGTAATAAGTGSPRPG